jgi:hypothetical protein
LKRNNDPDILMPNLTLHGGHLISAAEIIYIYMDEFLLFLALIAMLIFFFPTSEEDLISEMKQMQEEIKTEILRLKGLNQELRSTITSLKEDELMNAHIIMM